VRPNLKSVSHSTNVTQLLDDSDAIRSVLAPSCSHTIIKNSFWTCQVASQITTNLPGVLSLRSNAAWELGSYPFFNFSTAGILNCKVLKSGLLKKKSAPLVIWVVNSNALSHTVGVAECVWISDKGRCR